MSREGYFFIFLIMILLLVVILILCVYLFSLKQQMKRLQMDLRLTREMDNNQQLTVSLFDKDLSNLTTEMNHNLDFQKQLKLENERKEQQMKQSVSDIAHDLRTPLTVVKGNLQLLEQDEKISVHSRSYIQICLEKTDVLKNMVDDFFELSVLESERIVTELKRIDLTNYVMQFILEHEAVIVRNGMTPEFCLPEKTVFVMADEGMLERMFSNLLNNILKYAKETFAIALVEDSQKVMLSFSNPIPENAEFDVGHLFDRTYRADKARQGNGAGLGLYIVKLLAEKQQIEVNARREDDLLCFDLVFKQCKS